MTGASGEIRDTSVYARSIGERFVAYSRKKISVRYRTAKPPCRRDRPVAADSGL
jgi:hypothetical protein